MNPLKLQLPVPGGVDPKQRPPAPAEIEAWLTSLPLHDPKACLPQVVSLLERYNRCDIPTSQRLAGLQVLQARQQELLDPLQQKYRGQPLPLNARLRTQADEVKHLLEEMTGGYKRIVNDVICDEADAAMSSEHFLLALRQTIVQMGLLLLECYALYAPVPEGLWGELHRLYQFAERNGLHTMALASTDPQGQPLTTVQHAYLRIVMLALAQPYHLMAGQAEQIYHYLHKWTAGCRILEKRDTVAEAGDIVIDLAGNRPPALATGRARFRPVNGRFLDIRPLQLRLGEVRKSLEKRTANNTASPPLTLAERLRRDLLTRLCRVWEGRGERETERCSDDPVSIEMCVGLGATHHHISGEEDFTPEKDEIRYHRPDETDQREQLELLEKEDESWRHADPAANGHDSTRVSQFNPEVDVWKAIHNTEIQARSLREAAMAGYTVEQWQRLNHSSGGMALQQQPNNHAQVQVGALTTFRTESGAATWHVGVIRWLQDNGAGKLEVGIMSLTDTAAAIAVRAVAGGEYFRSLLVQVKTPEGIVKGVIVPASIFDIGTQLVLNLKTEIKYVQLSRIIETTSAFSLFDFDAIEIPPQEQARIQAIRPSTAD